MFVSVIVPNYNHAIFLDQRIQSILNQTYQDFELIILDDCSPDEGASRKVIEQYRDNPHISHIVYNEENSGSTFRQWDKGVNLAKGELIWIAESDDYCENNILDKLVREFKNDEELVLAYSLSQRVTANGSPLGYICRTPSGVTRLKGKNFVIKYMTMGNHCKNASACLFKKSAYHKIDKSFVSYKAGGDMLFWIEIAEIGNVSIVNERLNYFRQHNNKVTPNSVKKGISSKEYKKTFDYVNSHFEIGKVRKKLMLDYYRFTIEYRKYESEDIRKDIFNYWKVAPLSLPSKVFIKIILAIRNRLNIYF